MMVACYPDICSSYIEKQEVWNSTICSRKFDIHEKQGNIKDWRLCQMTADRVEDVWTTVTIWATILETKLRFLHKEHLDLQDEIISDIKVSFMTFH